MLCFTLSLLLLLYVCLSNDNGEVTGVLMFRSSPKIVFSSAFYCFAFVVEEFVRSFSLDCFCNDLLFFVLFCGFSSAPADSDSHDNM